MKNYLKYFICASLSLVVFTSCFHYRKLITDEVVLKDENSYTGTIQKCDSANLKLKRPDESVIVIPWTNIDTIQGKKFKTLFLGANFGYYNVPYFSVFKNESMVARQFGTQLKIGLASRGNRLYYFNLTLVPSQPYAVTKTGLGYQKYLRKSNYLKDNCFFIGGEFNFMNAKQNNGAQMTLEPFAGFEKKFNNQLRFHYKLGLQFNLANKNNQSGFNMTFGIHYMRKNFKKYYDILNGEHRIPPRRGSRK